MCAVILLAVKPCGPVIGYRRFEIQGCLPCSLQPDKDKSNGETSVLPNITHLNLSPANFFPESGDDKLRRNAKHPQDSEVSQA